MELPRFRKLEFQIVDEVIAVLTFNIPEKLNALDLDCHEDLHTFVDFLEATGEIRVGIINSAVEKAFMSGIDITGLQEGYFPENRLKEAIDRIENCDTPVIAAINGYCLGGGVELAMGCDIRVLADTAKLGLPEVGLGIIPGAGGIQRLARVAGIGIAKELALTTRRLDAQEAYAKGLAALVVPYDTLWDETIKLAKRIAVQAPLAVSLAKQAANIALDTDKTTAYLLEKWGMAILSTTKDAEEGKTAFVEKRQAGFTGK
jgi:enoyl-CoA hydratase